MKGGACRAFHNPGCNHLPNLPLLVLWSGYLEPFLADIPPPILNLNTKSLKEKGIGLTMTLLHWYQAPENS